MKCHPPTVKQFVFLRGFFIFFLSWKLEKKRMIRKQAKIAKIEMNEEWIKIQFALLINHHTHNVPSQHTFDGRKSSAWTFLCLVWLVSFCSSFLILKISGICQTKRKKSIGNCCFLLLLQIDSDGTEDSARVVVGCGAGDGGGGRCSCRGGGDSGRWRRHGPDGRLVIGRWWSVGDGRWSGWWSSSGRCRNCRKGRVQSDAVGVEADCDAHGAHGAQPNCTTINPIPQNFVFDPPIRIGFVLLLLLLCWGVLGVCLICVEIRWNPEPRGK